MLSLLDIAERMQRGPKVDENAWNMGLFKKMNELTAKYQLYYPKDGSFFSTDDAVADRAFRAALDYLVEKGIYCLTTGRVIQLTEQEVLGTIKAMPKEYTVGEGKDARVLKQRRLEEKEGLNHCPGHHAPFAEELAPLVVKNFAEIPTADYLEGINFAVVDGREIFGMPLEVYAARREAAWMRQGVTKAGRPGLAIAYYPINTRAADMIAPIDREVGFRPSDGVLLSVLPDIKVEQDYLTAAIVWEEYGGFKLNGNGSGSVGGFAGDLGGALIEAIVQVLSGFIVYRDIACWGGVRSSGTMASAKEVQVRPAEVWASSVWSQALHRHTNYIIFIGAGGLSGPGCETHLLEVAYRAATIPINGGNVHITRQFRARMNASQSPLDAEWSYEVAEAVMRSNHTRDTASDLLRKIGEKLKGRVPEAPYNDIREFYDLVHHKPLPAFEKAYLKVKDELASLGLEFK
ncbi:MAG: monomethylamine:corrinoid methyltransferase [Chloroflexota bacterium]|nr:monomethylamine:corrinoid methyltransferase [Chloroflexota bacterium]